VTVIDASVFITFPALVPVRFPISTLFAFQGAVMGLFYVKKKQYLIITIYTAAIIFGFLMITHFLPIIFNESSKKDGNLTGQNNEKLGRLIVKNMNNENFLLADVLKQNKINLLEFYFVGCLPCAQKQEALKTVKDSIQGKPAGIIFICDGKASTYKEFVEDTRYAQSNAYYDSSGSITAVLNSANGGKYPYEVIMNSQNKILSSYGGFNIESKKIYEKETIQKLNDFLLLTADDKL
jgi:AhpC/TSA family